MPRVHETGKVQRVPLPNARGSGIVPRVPETRTEKYQNSLH